MGFKLKVTAPWWLRTLAKWAQGRSFRALTSFGRTVGWWVYHLVPVRRWTVVRKNLGAAFPALDRKARAAIAREAYQSLGASVFELLGASQLAGLHPDALAELVQIEGREHLTEALARGRGVIVATAHLGGFDLAACACVREVPSLHVVTRRLKSQGLDGFWQSTRAALGVHLHEARGSMSSLLTALKHGGCVVLMVDQRSPVSEGGTAVQFFGREADTTIAPAVLSARSGAPIVMARCLREASGSHRVLLHPALSPPGPTRPEWVALTQTVTSEVERWVRDRPGEWLWLHDRWRRVSQGPAKGRGRAKHFLRGGFHRAIQSPKP